jgi:long-chain acyl-CoA synthetase
LQRHGLVEGDRVAVVAPPSAAYLGVAIGALRIGIVPVLLNPALTAGEQSALLADADPALVLRDTEVAELIATTDAEVDLAPHPRARPMLFTSGTTGRPKGVWSGVLDDAAAASLIDEEAELWGFTRDDRLLVVSPLHHSAPLRFSTGTLLAGGSVVLGGGTDALGAVIAEHRPTTAFVAPVHLQRLFGLGDDLPSLASFRLVAHAGAPCPHSLKQRAFDAFPTGSVWEFYGSTEGQFTACSPEEWLEAPGTVGRARSGRQLDVDADGMIWCRVPSHARFTYWRDPEKTAQAWRGDAFTVGDVGRIDADGFLFLDGRRDDLIITGGVNVYPVEVELAILRHPGVADAMVFGVDDDRWGQMVCAAIVGDVRADALDAFLRDHIAAYKRPKRIVVVDELPHSPTGKLSRSRAGELLGLTGPGG